MRGTSHSCLSADSLLRTIDAPTAPSKGAPRSTAQPNLASSARTSKRPTASLVPWAASAKSATGPPPHSHGLGMREVSLRRWFGNQSGACRVAWQVVRESYRGAVWQSARAMSSAAADAGMAGIRLANVTHSRLPVRRHCPGGRCCRRQHPTSASSSLSTKSGVTSAMLLSLFVISSTTSSDGAIRSTMSPGRRSPLYLSA